jgi:hypothetical protein
MNLFGVIWKDRHSGSDMEIFTDEEKAKKWAEISAYETARESDDVEIHTLTNDMKKGNWKFYITYDCEGSGLIVVEIEVDRKLPKE